MTEPRQLTDEELKIVSEKKQAGLVQESTAVEMKRLYDHLNLLGISKEKDQIVVLQHMQSTKNYNDVEKSALATGLIKNPYSLEEQMNNHFERDSGEFDTRGRKQAMGGQHELDKGNYVSGVKAPKRKVEPVQGI